MLKISLLSLALIGTLFLSGCGEDSSTEPRLNYITMINATQNTISSDFAGEKKDIAIKEQRDKIIADVSEAPKVSYDDVGEVTLSKGEKPRTYVATTCKDTHITFTSGAGELSLVNTKTTDAIVQVNDTNVTVTACSYNHVKDVVFEDKTITIKMGNASADIKPGSEDIWSTVIFDDDSLKSFRVKFIDL